MGVHKIYFARRSDGLIKIGTSRSVKTRIGELARSHGPLEIIRIINGDVLRERQVHGQFCAYREYGEWFRSQGGALEALIMSLPEGDEAPVAVSDSKRDFAVAERDLVAEAKTKLDRIVELLTQRAGLTIEKALDAACAEYGFGKSFATHLSRATTVSAAGLERVRSAYREELAASLAYFQAEIERASGDGFDDDAEILSLGARIEELRGDFAARVKARKEALK